MTIKLATLLLTTFAATMIFSAASQAQDAPKHFSKRLEIPRSERLKNFSNNVDTPAIVSNRNKNRYERKRGQNRNNKTTAIASPESRTMSENVTPAAQKQGRRQNAQQSRNRNNRNQDAQIMNDIAKGLLND